MKNKILKYNLSYTSMGAFLYTYSYVIDLKLIHLVTEYRYRGTEYTRRVKKKS